VKLLHVINETQEAIHRARGEGKTIGLVPTMGALHEGHIALIRRAREECDFVVVSIFINPTQFEPSDDFSKYPRTLVADAEKCQEAGVDIIFAPSAAEMYPDGFDSWVEVKGFLTETLEGESRPGHYKGVTTVCCKLFNIAQPDLAYFGMKDHQQLKAIQKMVIDLNMPLRIVPVETVREPDGLAMSSRNAYLSPSEKKAALVLSKALIQAKKAFDSGESDPNVVKDIALNLIKAEPLACIDYVAVVDAETLQPIARMVAPAVVLVAVRVGSTRLIDNIILNR
jgi:pantoate--beta-alanine ligase